MIHRKIKIQQKKNIRLGIIKFFTLIILIINISFTAAEEKKKGTKSVLVEINILDKVSSKNTILNLNIGEEKKIPKFRN